MNYLKSVYNRESERKASQVMYKTKKYIETKMKKKKKLVK